MEDHFGSKFRDIVFKYMFRLELSEEERFRLFPEERPPEEPQSISETKEEIKKYPPDVSLPNWPNTKKP